MTHPRVGVVRGEWGRSLCGSSYPQIHGVQFANLSRASGPLETRLFALRDPGDLTLEAGAEPRGAKSQGHLVTLWSAWVGAGESHRDAHTAPILLAIGRLESDGVGRPE